MNKIILIGRTGKDVEVRQTQSGTTIANTSLATSKKIKGEEKTQWHNLVMFNKTAEIAEKYAPKGSQICIEGELEYNQWEDRDGNKRSTPQIVVNRLYLLGSKSSNATQDTPATYNTPQVPPFEEYEPSKDVATGDGDDLPF